MNPYNTALKGQIREHIAVMWQFPIHILPFNNMIAYHCLGEKSIIYLSSQMTSQQSDISTLIFCCSRSPNFAACHLPVSLQGSNPSIHVGLTNWSLNHLAALLKAKEMSKHVDLAFAIHASFTSQSVQIELVFNKLKINIFIA